MSVRFTLAGLGITREPRLVAGTAVSAFLPRNCVSVQHIRLHSHTGTHIYALQTANCTVQRQQHAAADSSATRADATP
jgi:hypothetical protein